MTTLLQQFDATQFDPTQNVGGLPVGRHPVVIDSTTIEATKNNDGGFLQLNLRVIDGPSMGTVGAYRLNLYNKSQQAVDIANRQFSAVCHVTGVYRVTDADQLKGIPFIVEVEPQASNPQYTQVSRVFDRNGNEPGKSTAGQQQAPQTAQAGQQQPPQGAWSQQPQQGQQGQQPSQNPAQGQPAAWGNQGAAPQGGQPQGQQTPAGAPATGTQWASQGTGQQQPQQGQQPAGNTWQQGAGGGNVPWQR